MVKKYIFKIEPSLSINVESSKVILKAIFQLNVSRYFYEKLINYDPFEYEEISCSNFKGKRTL